MQLACHSKRGCGHVHDMCPDQRTTAPVTPSFCPPCRHARNDPGLKRRQCRRAHPRLAAPVGFGRGHVRVTANHNRSHLRSRDTRTKKRSGLRPHPVRDAYFLAGWVLAAPSGQYREAVRNRTMAAVDPWRACRNGLWSSRPLPPFATRAAETLRWPGANLARGERARLLWDGALPGVRHVRSDGELCDSSEFE